MISTPISRRAWLLAAAAGAGAACAHNKAPRLSGYCFVANQGSRTVAVISLERLRVQKYVTLDAAPDAILPHPRKPKVFVLAPDAGTVLEIDAGNYTVSRRVRAGNQAAGMQLAPDGSALWVLYRDPAALVEVPLESFKPGRRIRLSAPPDSFDLAVHEKRNVPLAAIASRQDHTIAIASLEQAAIERTIVAPDEPSIVRFQAKGVQTVAGSWAGRSATFFESASGRTLVRLPLPLAPRQFCNNTDGGQLFITGDGMDAVVVVYPYKTEIYQTMLAGHAPGAMAVVDVPGGAGSYLMVANPQSDGLTVLDIDSYSLVAVVQVGQGPVQVLAAPDQQYALVLNQRSGDLAVIRIHSLATTPDGLPRTRNKTAPLFTLIPVGENPVNATVMG